MTVDIVVPARNEARRLAGVLEPISVSGAAARIIVVADDCTDRTELVAQQFGEVVRSSAANKGTAMALGLRAVTADLVLFIDADLEGLLPEHVQALATLPPLDGQVVGIRGDVPSGALAANLPSLSGERRLPVAVAVQARLAGSGWKAETRLNVTVARMGLPWRQVVLKGTSNPTKIDRHPLAWLAEMGQVATVGLAYAPELVAYTARPGGS